jgi:hypothetical protein
MSRKIVTVVLALGVVAFGFAMSTVYLWQQREEAIAATETEKIARERAERRTLEIQSKYESLESEYIHSQQTNVPAKRPIEASTERSTHDTRQSPIAAAPLLRRSAHTDLIGTLKLTEPLASDIARLLADEQTKFGQLISERKTSFVDPQAVESLRAETDRAARALLGEPKYQEYLDFRNYATERGRIDRLDERLKSDGIEPLSDYQRESLLTAMKEEKSAMPVRSATQYATRKEFQEAAAASRTAYERRVQQRVEAILTPTQLDRFDNGFYPGL